MATKTIAWTTGGGYITLTYTGQGNGSISVASDENTDFEPRQQSFKVVTTNGTPEQAIDILVKQAGKTYPVGEVFNFDYTGSVQQITLPKGKYKLQCWGAQGGTSYKSGTETYTSINLSNYTTKDCSLGSNSWYFNGTNGKHKAVPISGYKRIKITVTGGNDGGWLGFVKSSYSTPSHNGTIPYSSYEPDRIWQYTGTMEYDVPSDAAYLIVCPVDGAGNTPSFSVSYTTGTTSSGGAGSKGGYSEGVLTLTQTTTLYIFVGGKGSRGSSGSLVNGGWNGGGGSVGYSSYNSGGTNGYSYPACGGGATDISTVTSSMSYSDGRTNRNAASLLARCIVAGGGAGGSYVYTSITTTTTTPKTTKLTMYQGSMSTTNINVTNASNTRRTYSQKFAVTAGVTYTITCASSYTCWYMYDWTTFVDEGWSKSWTFTPPKNGYIRVSCGLASNLNSNITPGSENVRISYNTTSTNTSTSETHSNQSQQGGGTSGRGQYPGTQSAAGRGSQAGGFGYGANQLTTGNRYDSGAGGGGWYGGGSYTSDSSTNAVNYSGGGSGFVNTAANASYRPIEYTGLQLDSGETIAGNTSHPSVSGGTETGHSGNGYARITVIE